MSAAPAPSGGAVLCVGRLYCDLVFTGVPRLPSLGTEVFAEGLSLHAGGGPTITAACLAALGRPVGLAATLPVAPFDTPMRAELDRLGVSDALCDVAPEGSDPQLTAVMVSGGERAFLTRAPGAALPRLSAGDLDGFAHVHIGELKSLMENPWLVPLARGAGLTISLDCGWEDVLPDGAADLIASVDLFLPNRAESFRLAEAGLGDSPAMLTVVKAGADGAFAHQFDNVLHVPAEPVAVVDTTGAGDAFNGGFLHRWLEKAPLEECLALGNICGARAVSAVGGTAGLAGLGDRLAGKRATTG
ncbi:carbohydrate kinase family protein [Pelagovum pacificum]|uniref:Carbohydrate kinase n=1 Tax=Pelagovum pacificum TaxID=2588711 RepID=A0A5C5GAE4_9RHOB|nr:PfkB family carbohydrate kinase [Pelagovum pacificum]QQA41701.1 carbohydrate kinase [Pelagovum pacificum]TNY30978.1 carbohydrate kinase [Pelagovum pacificum]